MRTIQLNTKSVDLPDCWGDLTVNQKKYAFSLLIKLYAGDITPFEFKVRMFIKITGYKPKKKSYIGYLKVFFVKLFYSIERFDHYQAEQNLYRENIQDNLLHLIDMMDFAFDMDGETIVPNYLFPDNPFLSISDTCPHFIRSYTVDTNITARQFSDCIDLLSEINGDIAQDVKYHLLCKMVSILYDITMEQAQRLPIEVLFGVSFWFTGVTKFFREHPRYSILFSSSNIGDNRKISLGMSEVILYLKKEGYSDSSDMNLIDFFDAQVKALKDSISKAVSSGVKIENLVQSTGIDYNTLNRLV